MAAQDAELKLRVSLDLGFFRQQLAGLGQAAAGYNLPVKVKFDRLSVQDELNALGRNIKQRNYKLEVKTNLDAEIKKAKDLAEALKSIGQGSAAIKGVATKASPKGITGNLIDDKTTYKQLQSLYRFADKAQLPFEKLTRGAASSTNELRRVLSSAFSNVGSDVKTGISSSLKDASSDLAKIGKDMGTSLLKAVKSELGIASPSKEFKKVGEDSGKGFEQGLKISFGEAGDVGVREIEKLFQRLQKEAKAGSALLQAIMAGAMGGVMQLPGGRQRGAGGSIGSMIRQQRAQVQAERQAQAGGLSALMTGMMGGVIPMGGKPRGAGGSIGAMIRQQRTAVQAQRQAQTGSLSALMMGMMGGVVPMPGKPRGAGGSITELIQQERTKARERNQPQRIEKLIAALSSARGNLSPAAGVNQRLSTGGASNQGLLSSGFINSAISPKYVNYPQGMPAAYQGRFIEPSAYASSLATAGLSRFNMGGTSAGQFPMSPMMTGGIGSGGGSFIPMDPGKSVSTFGQSIGTLIQKAKEASSVLRSQMMPTFKDLRAQAVDTHRRVATQFGAEGGYMGNRYVNLRGSIASRGGFPTEGMMTPEGITANAARTRNYSIRQNAIGGNFPLGAPYVTQTGGVGSYAFPMAGMMAPSSPLPGTGGFGPGGGSFIPTGGGGGGGNPPSGRGGGGFGGMGGLGNFARAMGGVSLPGAGTVKELGSEFAFATKQVLLFGQAYKMLGFIQSFPAQVGEAVGQLQNFRNTLGAISPTADEVAASNQLILDLVDKYNVPLQSARDGFTKLYASMAPAGFSGDEVRDLFTGITQAAATFGMSADKVDRVNYAFAQMASKGQVMSEELKGQLGDVLPGAMALFAEAAGFEGPKAIQDFSAALEDGAYKGEAMVALLKNVGLVMKQEFGPGAEGAARTFQGVINRMQNSMTLLYESFEPVAVNFLNGVVVPLTAGIKQISDGFNAFFTSTAAQTSGGLAIAQELERLRPAFDGISQNVSALVAQLGQFARIGLEVGKVLLQIAGNPFVGYLARVYINILALTTAIQILNLRALIPMIASFARSTYALITFTVQCIRAGQAVQVTGLMLRTFFATTGVGLVILGIGLLTEKFMSMNQVLADTQAKALGAADAIRSMSQTEARAAEQQAQKAYSTIGRVAGRKGEETVGPGKDRIVELTPAELKELQQVGAIQTAKDPFTGKITARRSDVMSLAPQAQRLQAQATGRIRDLRFEEKQTQQQAAIAPMPAAAAEAKGTANANKLDTYNKSQLDFIEQRLDAEKQVLDQQLQANLLSQTSYDIKLAELTLETKRAELQERFRLETEKIKADNLSEADKALALKDQELFLQNALVQAEKKRDIAIKGAKLELRKPFIDALRGENMEIDKQEVLLGNLKKGLGELTPEQEANFLIEEKIAQLKADEQKIIQTDINNLREQIKLRIENGRLLEKENGLFEAQRGLGTIGGGLRAGFTGSAAGVFERAMAQYDDVDYATKLANIETSAMQLRSVFEGLQGAISGVSNAFANVLTEGIVNMITGTATAKEVFASFLQSVGQSLSQAAAQMIATYVAIGIAKMFAGLGGGAAKPDAVANLNAGVAQYGGGLAFANGGIAPGGFRAFANGGVVSGPTLGLVGEGKYNEAVVPLPDGKSIPVQLGGSARELLSGGMAQQAASPVLSMSFQTTKFGDKEYVDINQLQAAMAETRKMATREGAAQGSQLALSKLKNSPNTRRQLGLR